MSRHFVSPFQQPSFSLSNRLRRFVWGCVQTLLFRPSPIPMHRWRAWLLGLFGASIHPSCHVYPTVVIWAPWNLAMELDSCLGPKVTCYNMAFIRLGERAVVSQGTHLCTGSHDYESDDFHLFALPIIIGADAWVCAEVFVAPGVTIGDGAVIGARSVVTRSQPSWTVSVGNPCRPRRPRRRPAYARQNEA